MAFLRNLFRYCQLGLPDHRSNSSSVETTCLLLVAVVNKKIVGTFQIVITSQ